MIPTPEQIEPYVADGLVTARRHPRLPLTIYNYTQEAQYSRHWDDVTINCRGLVLDDRGAFVMRGMPKFFNLGEREGGPKLEDGILWIAEKYDGTLIISGNYEGEHVVATRGSFTSPHLSLDAPWDQVAKPKTGVSYCYEMIHPEDRKVVDYGPEPRFVFLGRVSPSGRWWQNWDTVRHLADPLVDRPGKEGYVVGLKTGMVKVKHESYVKAHRLLCSLNPKRVKEALVEGTADDLLAQLPEEHRPWFQENADRMTAAFFVLEGRLRQTYREVERSKAPAWRTIKDIGGDLTPALFAMHNGKDWEKLLWKLVPGVE